MFTAIVLSPLLDLPSVRHARTKNLSKQFKPGCPGIITRVTFIGIDMHFQLDGVTHPAKKFFENHGTIACHAQIKAIAVFDLIKTGIRRAHVNMAFMADNPLGKMNHSSRAE
jgi:hypothetical protein